MSRRRPRRRLGTLNLIAGFLVVSAMIRVASVPVPVMAEEGGADLADIPPAATAEAPAPVAPAEDTSALMVAFQQREARLAAREAQLVDRLQALRVAEVEVAQQMAALKAAEEALTETIAMAEVAAQADIERLVAVYENMKPKDAAELFQQMSPDFAAGFLGMMNAEAAANIMTLVPPDVSYAISVVLAGRNANVPTQ